MSAFSRVDHSFFKLSESASDGVSVIRGRRERTFGTVFGTVFSVGAVVAGGSPASEEAASGVAAAGVGTRTKLTSGAKAMAVSDVVYPSRSTRTISRFPDSHSVSEYGAVPGS